MESYGAILKQARENKGLDFDTVERDTAIKRDFLEALENENTAVFPGEPYLIGFLHNYADYLGIDVKNVISLYHAKQIQESPPPPGLIVHEKSRLFKIFMIAGAAVLVVAAFVVFLFVSRCTLQAKNGDVAVSKPLTPHQYTLTDKPFTGRVYTGDQIIIPAKSGKVVLTVAQTLNSLSLETPVGIQYIDLSEELEIDVDGDGIPEVIVYVSDVSTTDESRGAEVKLMLKAGGSEAGTVDANAIPLAANLPASETKTVILEDNRAYPFTINASFRAGCLFRYRCDRQDLVEDYFTSGDIVTMTASNGIRLWVSNGNTVKLQVVADSKSYDLEVSKAGQIVAEDIKWIKDTDGKYKLVVLDLE